MALHKNFSKSPYEILDPKIRWFPADEDLREKGYEKLLPPLVAELRKKLNMKCFMLSRRNGRNISRRILGGW